MSKKNMYAAGAGVIALATYEYLCRRIMNKKIKKIKASGLSSKQKDIEIKKARCVMNKYLMNFFR